MALHMANISLIHPIHKRFLSQEVLSTKYQVVLLFLEVGRKMLSSTEANGMILIRRRLNSLPSIV